MKIKSKRIVGTVLGLLGLFGASSVMNTNNAYAGTCYCHYDNISGSGGISQGIVSAGSYVMGFGSTCSAKNGTIQYVNGSDTVTVTLRNCFAA